MKLNRIITVDGVQFLTEIEDMEHLGELGNGTCGQVVKMRHKPSGAITAVKVSVNLSLFHVLSLVVLYHPWHFIPF